MMQLPNASAYLGMWFSLNINIFPAISSDSPGFVSLPNFLEVTFPIERFKPRHVFVRRKLLLSPLDTEPSPDPPPMEPRRSSHISHPLKRYDDECTSLTATLSGISVPTCYS